MAGARDVYLSLFTTHSLDVSASIHAIHDGISFQEYNDHSKADILGHAISGESLHPQECKFTTYGISLGTR